MTEEVERSGLIEESRNPLEKAPPTNDVVFKLIFGDNRHKRVLLHFLNCCLPDEAPITDVEIVQTEITPEHIEGKLTRLDIVAKTQSGELANIEIQCDPKPGMVARSLYYWGQLYTRQLKKRGRYTTLRRTIGIIVLDFRLFKEDDKFWRKCRIYDTETKEELTSLLELQFMELPKMREVDEKSPITFWLKFLQDPYSEEVQKICTRVPEIREAKDLFERAKADPAAQELWRMREKGLTDYYAGIAEAEERGREEGEALGREEGRLEMALRFLDMGFPLEQIARAAHLPEQEILAMRSAQHPVS